MDRNGQPVWKIVPLFICKCMYTYTYTGNYCTKQLKQVIIYFWFLTERRLKLVPIKEKHSRYTYIHFLNTILKSSRPAADQLLAVQHMLRVILGFLYHSRQCSGQAVAITAYIHTYIYKKYICHYVNINCILQKNRESWVRW